MVLHFRQIPTPALGINGLKHRPESPNIERTFYSNARFGHEWIETTFRTQPQKFRIKIPTPALGINGLKLLFGQGESRRLFYSNARFGHKWIETFQFP